MVLFSNTKIISLNKNPTKDIFLCLGPDINFSFRHLLEYYSTDKKHQQSIEIISTIEEAFLSVDIKLHPQEKDAV